MTKPNLFPDAIRVAKDYANSIRDPSPCGRLSHISSLYIIDCLEKASYGFNQYLNAQSEFQRRLVITDKIMSGLKAGETANTKEHDDAMNEAQLATVYHVRAIYGELWNAAETAKKDLNGSFLPNLKSFKPRSLTLVRNNLLVHQTAKPENLNLLALGISGGDAGYILFPDRDLDGKGTTDKGLIVTVEEYLEDLKQRMITHLEP